MRVYLTGARGFVGPRLARRLAQAGFQTFGNDAEVDVTDLDAVERAFAEARPDAVIHLAAQSSVAASWRDPGDCFRVNYLGSRCVLRALARQCPSARLLLIGSAEQYDVSRPGEPPRRESDPLCPRSPYARSKAAAEQLGSLAAESGLDVVRVRAFNHTGPGQSMRFVASDFAHQVAEIEAGLRPARMRVGNLESLRDFLDVDDVVEAYLALLDPVVPADIYNVASGQGVPIRSLLETLCELAGVSPQVETDPERHRPTDWLVGDASRLRAACDWQPRVPLRATLERVLDHWRVHLRPAAAQG
jgi:GDP-4-dehydro-6-deoxy-D-mannose reductase